MNRWPFAASLRHFRAPSNGRRGLRLEHRFVIGLKARAEKPGGLMQADRRSTAPFVRP